MPDREKWAVVYYSYDPNEDCAINIDRVTGPHSFDKALNIECAYNGPGYVDIGLIEEDFENAKI